MNERKTVDDDPIELRITAFKQSLDESSQTEQFIVQKYITHGTPYIFRENEDLYFDLKYDIAQYFSLNSPEMVRMVGSAKLGFSLAPKKLWQKFSEESDIDMVIISQSLFEEYWSELYNFNIDLTDRSNEEQKNYKKFLEYFFKGWLRPDLFPFKYSKKNEWFDFFNSISYKKYGNNEITGAIYYDFRFFEGYHIQNIKKLRLGGSSHV